MDKLKELTVDQALEIKELREFKRDAIDALKIISNTCVGVSAPLNDNCKQYTIDQLKDFRKINNKAKSLIFY